MKKKKKEYSLLEKKISSERVFSGNLLQVYKDRVLLPDGRASEREWIKHPGASAVLPVFESGEVQLLKQFWYALRIKFLEVPAGKIDPGEEPIRTAKRELEEECGVRARHWTSLGVLYPGIGYSNEVIHLYLAWGLEVHDNSADDDEFVEPVRVLFKNAVEQTLNGEITDAKTIITILRAAKWWKENAPFPIRLTM